MVIKIVIDPFAFAGPVPKYRMTKEEIERDIREKERQREIDEEYRRKLIEKGLIPPENESER